MDKRLPRPTARIVAHENHPSGESAGSFLVITAAEAAALFNKSARTWRTWDSSGKIPRPIRIGRTTYWRPDELQAWVAAGCPDRETWEERHRDCATSGLPEKSRRTPR